MGRRENAADEPRIRAQQSAQRLASEQLAADLGAVLGSRAGRHVLWWLLEDAGLYGSTFHENPSWAAFLEGQRNAGLRLLALIEETDPKALLTLMDEHRKMKKSDDARPTEDKETEDA